MRAGAPPCFPPQLGMLPSRMLPLPSLQAAPPPQHGHAPSFPLPHLLAGAGTATNRPQYPLLANIQRFVDEADFSSFASSSPAAPQPSTPPPTSSLPSPVIPPTSSSISSGEKSKSSKFSIDSLI